VDLDLDIPQSNSHLPPTDNPCEDTGMRKNDDMPTNNGNGERSGGRRSNLKLWLVGALGVYLVLFVLTNTDPVDVNFVLFQAKDIGLIWVMLLVAVIAFAIGWVTGRAGRRDKRSKKS
jgi:uncharacterized integral membrane protein